MSSSAFMIVESAFLSAVIWFSILVVVMYFARSAAHHGILSLTRVLHNAMRLSARSVTYAERALKDRNREVLLAQGREAAERIIEREFERVDAAIRKDLSEYPALHRQLSEQITRIDEEYKQSAEVPPNPPGWVKAVEAVASIPAKDDPMVGNILEDIHHSMVKANNNAIEEYRKASHKRHNYLKDMMPHWRRILQVLGVVDKNVNSLLERSKVIDRHMDDYENIVRKTARSERMLSSSSLTQFFISFFVLAIAVGGAIINFNLIARPMSEMVGGTSRIMGFQTSQIAALVIILVEIAMGLFLMESMRITRLFPVIGALNDKIRIRMMWASFSILFILASVEAGLAFMRELLMEEDAATRAVLRGAEGEVVQSSYLWITTAAQMGMGFILPFALTFVAIPLETFVHSLRTAMGIFGVAILSTIAWVFRLIGNISRHIGITLVNLYDIVIFIPLSIENAIKGKGGKRDRSAKPGVA